MGLKDMTTRRFWLALALLATFVRPTSAQVQLQAQADPRDTSKPLSVPGAVQSQQPTHMDAVFEVLPSKFDTEVVLGQSNLHFVPIRSNAGNILLAWGGIGSGDAIRFNLALTAAKPVAEVQLFSQGGVLQEGMKIGRMIRAQQLGTRITSGSMCASACNFIFLGGVVRIAEPGARFGVHMFSNDAADRLLSDLTSLPASVDEFNDRFPEHAVKRYAVTAWIDKQNGEKPAEPVTEKDYFRQATVVRSIADERVRDIQQDAAMTSTAIAFFLIEMRLSMRFLVEFAGQSSYGIKWLKQDEMHSYNIVTN